MEEIWKHIPNLSAPENPNNTFDGMNLQEFLATPFVYPNLNPVFPATTATVLLPATNNVLLWTPQGNSLPLSSHQPMTCSSQRHIGFNMQSRATNARKRLAVPCEDDQNNISRSSRGDRGNQRLIKNRESAARSRDRKEAYTAQLVDQLETLKAENAKLKMKQQLHEAAQGLKKHTLKRSASSPF